MADGTELLLIGIGAGDPGWLTLEAAEALGRLDVVFVVLKESRVDDLVHARRLLLERHAPQSPRLVELPDPPRPWRTASDYDAAVARWREQRRIAWTAALRELRPGETGGFLVWGDPGLYESTLAIVTEALDALPEPPALRVLPGISSVLALAARHRVPLNRQGRAVQVSPTRLVAGGMPDGVDDVVCLLDAHETFASIDPAGLDIYWGAYLGTPDEVLVAGDLAGVRDEIRRVRAEAIARKGWIFDSYLLRRRAT